MQHPETHTVTPDNGPAPAGKPNECFSCNEPVGSPHKADCVCRKRTVILRVAFDLLVDEPESWSVEDIEFARNESSWCADNIISELEDAEKRAGNSCLLCPSADILFVREATEDDEEHWHVGNLIEMEAVTLARLKAEEGKE